MPRETHPTLPLSPVATPVFSLIPALAEAAGGGRCRARRRGAAASLTVTRTGRAVTRRILLVITSLAIALLWDQAAGEQGYASPGLQPLGFPSLHQASFP